MPQRIGEGAGNTTNATNPSAAPAALERPPTAPANTATGLDRATGEHNAPALVPDTNVTPLGASSSHPMLSVLSAAEEHLTSSRPSAFKLIDGRYPDAIGLDVILAQMGNRDQLRAAVRLVIEDFTQKTGIQVPAALVNAAIANPSKLADLLAVTPAQLSQSANAIAAAHKQGAIKDAKPKARILPQEFELANLSALPYTRPAEVTKQLVPGLFQGDLKSDLPDDCAKANTVLAEIFDRLAENPSKASKDRFSVKLAGREYRSLEAFVEGLERAGHKVEISFNQRIANFADLKTKIGDRWFDVPAGLLVKGDDGRGHTFALPAAHAEMLISVKGPVLNADSKFYQGMTSTGFFPCDLWRTPAWLGGQLAPEKFSGAKAVKAIALAGHLSDTIQTVARELGLPFAGYGALGVCMDSVAALRHAMTGKNDYWPLLMRDQLLRPQIEKRLSDQKKSDDDEYAALWKSMVAVPSDVVFDATAPARMLASLPWAEGREPFESVVLARRALSAQE